jgi:hypothetical protein
VLVVVVENLVLHSEEERLDTLAEVVDMLKLELVLLLESLLVNLRNGLHAK